jgi:hypothetical protein
LHFAWQEALTELKDAKPMMQEKRAAQTADVSAFETTVREKQRKYQELCERLYAIEDERRAPEGLVHIRAPSEHCVSAGIAALTPKCS